jgi:hypothetical protein
MVHAKLGSRIQSLIQPSGIRFALKGLNVTICVERLTDAGLVRDVHKPFAIRFALETVFFADPKPVSSAKINRRESQDAGKTVT